MSAYSLLLSLKALLERELAALPLPVRVREGTADAAETPLRVPAVHVGSMPPTVNDALASAPFVVVQTMEGWEASGLHHVRTALRLCVVCDDLEAGEEDLHNLISATRLALLSCRDGLLPCGRWRIVEDVERLAPWERPDDQVLPFLQAHIFITCQTQGVQHVACV